MCVRAALAYQQAVTRVTKGDLLVVRLVGNKLGPAGLGDSGWVGVAILLVTIFKVGVAVHAACT